MAALTDARQQLNKFPLSDEQIAAQMPGMVETMKEELARWRRACEQSRAGKNYK